MSDTTLKRRGFLKLAAAGGAAFAGVQAFQRTTTSGPEVETSPYSWVMVIDLEKCIGCGYCILACRAHNDIPPEITWNPIYKSEGSGDQTVFISRPCMHCADAPCVAVCPVKASYQRSDGIVMMDYDRCIGCRYCEVACPYYARSFNWEAFDGPNPAVPDWGLPEVPRRPRGVVEKCSFCYQRVDRGLENGLTPGVDPDATPACVVACPMGARIFGDRNDPESEVSRLIESQPAHRLREDLSTEPRVFYICPAGLEEVEL
ncbi:MAG TPA: 4Fe-4S dicluster domain-containing protein [Anaerolineales bacterium]|nr:4Fe-4S dicluster domain-containing protein [Anaerolineales bacterium]